MVDGEIPFKTSKKHHVWCLESKNQNDCRRSWSSQPSREKKFHCSPWSLELGDPSRWCFQYGGQLQIMAGNETIRYTASDSWYWMVGIGPWKIWKGIQQKPSSTGSWALFCPDPDVFCQSRFSPRLTAVGPTLLFEGLWKGKIKQKENQSTQTWNKTGSWYETLWKTGVYLHAFFYSLGVLGNFRESVHSQNLLSVERGVVGGCSPLLLRGSLKGEWRFRSMIKIEIVPQFHAVNGPSFLWVCRLFN